MGKHIHTTVYRLSWQGGTGQGCPAFTRDKITSSTIFGAPWSNMPNCQRFEFHNPIAGFITIIELAV